MTILTVFTPPLAFSPKQNSHSLYVPNYTIKLNKYSSNYCNSWIFHQLHNCTRQNISTFRCIPAKNQPSLNMLKQHKNFRQAFSKPGWSSDQTYLLYPINFPITITFDFNKQIGPSCSTLANGLRIITMHMHLRSRACSARYDCLSSP